MARLSTYSSELALEICERYATGESLKSILAGETMPALSTVQDWRKRYAEFGQAYNAAKQARAVALVEEMREIADNDHDAQRARNRIDVRKWEASRINREEYGEKIDVYNSVRVDIRAVLAEANQR